MEANVNVERKGTLQELAEIRSALRDQATGKGESLPAGVDPVVEEAPAKAQEGEGNFKAEHREASAPEPVALDAPIKIHGKEFRTAKEAEDYVAELEAEKMKLEEEKLLSESYNQGIRDALSSQALAQPAAPVPEENFEEQFYANPKETLNKMKEQAKAEALAAVNAEKQKEALWSQFFAENPDLDGQRHVCELVLQQNWDVLGNMTDIPKAMKILATKTRSVFQGYIEKTKPRTELPKASAQAVSTGMASAPNVTSAGKKEEPLDFITEMKKMRRRA